MSDRLPASWAGAAGAVSARGFTLIEGLVVVAILALLAALASPSFVSVVGTMNTKAAAFDLIGDLTMARSEALKRNSVVSVLPVSNAWSNGWEVRDGTEVLRQRPRPASSIAIVVVGGDSVFQPNGRLQSDVRYSITSSISGVTARCVVVSPTGSARSRPGACP